MPVPVKAQNFVFSQKSSKMFGCLQADPALPLKEWHDILSPWHEARPDWPEYPHGVHVMISVTYKCASSQFHNSLRRDARKNQLHAQSIK